VWNLVNHLNQETWNENVCGGGVKRKKVPGQNMTTVRAIKTIDIVSRLHTGEMGPDIFPVRVWKE
jgi:hypothetical protein